MNKNSLNISVPIIKNHLRLLKNWYLFEDNKLGLIFLVVLLFFSILPFSMYLGNQSSSYSQIGSILYTLILPIFVASKYLIFISKEDSLLLVMFDKKVLLSSKQLAISFLTLSIFSLMLLFGIIPHFLTIPYPMIIFIELLLLLIFSWLLPFISLKINFKVNVSKSTRFWDSRISNINLLPIRGIILREFLSLWRENKNSIIRIVLNAGLFNAALMFFIVNNAKSDFFIWVVLLQSFVFLTFVINYSTSNNISMMNSIKKKERYILIGEVIFWLTLYLIYLKFVVSIYGFILSQISIFPIVITVLLFAVSLLYVLLIRLAYAETQLTRSLIFLLMFIPITIPFYIYISYRRLK